MHSVGVRVFPPAPPCNTTPENTSSQVSPFSKRFNQTHLSFSSNRVTHFGFSVVLGQIRNGSGIFAIKSPRKGIDNSLEMEDLDLDSDEEFDEDFEEDEDEDEDIIVPIKNMRKWLENKPLGFGEGKEYDTSIEDKLAEEMEQSRLAQLANIKKLKTNPEGTKSKNQLLQKQKVSEVVSTGIRVRLVNLPKKKNITRDLQQAFKGVHGMTDIVPVVSGSKKTREPICTGIAFVYFKSEEDANRFIQTFSRQSIAFGKVHKQIKYEMMNSSSPKSSPEIVSNHGPRLAVISAENDLDAGSYVEKPTNNATEEILAEEYDSSDDEHASRLREETGENVEPLSALEYSMDDNNWVPKEESLANSASAQQLKKSRPKTKKGLAKRKGEKVSKLKIPGSANRLKIKEKSVLTDVFSKYGQKASVAVKEQS